MVIAIGVCLFRYTALIPCFLKFRLREVRQGHNAKYEKERTGLNLHILFPKYYSTLALRLVTISIFEETEGGRGCSCCTLALE